MKQVGRDKLKAAKTEILKLKENITQLEAGQGLMVSQRARIAELETYENEVKLLREKQEGLEITENANIEPEVLIQQSVSLDTLCVGHSEKVSVEPEVVIQQSASMDKLCMGHSEYAEGRTYYKIDDDKELRFVLCRLSCGMCGIVFGNNIKEGQHKPTTKTPVYACVSMRKVDHNCKHGVCSSCFTAGLMQSLESNKRQKRARQPTSKA